MLAPLAVKLIFKLVLLFISEVFLKGSNGEEFNLNFHQNDYQLKFERLELVRFNKNLARDVSIVTFKYNRTTAVANMTFTFMDDFGSDLTVVTQAYKFMSNEYRHFPMRYSANVCKAFASNICGIKSIMRCGNFTGCPFRKAKYHFCNWQPDSPNNPPFIPNGQYKLEIQLLHFSDEIAVFNDYMSIDRPIPHAR